MATCPENADLRPKGSFIDAAGSASSTRTEVDGDKALADRTENGGRPTHSATINASARGTAEGIVSTQATAV